MGCLKKIIKFIIFVLACIGVMALGGCDIFKENMSKIKFLTPPSQENLQEKATKIADFSKIGEEYKINRNISVMGFKSVNAEHKSSTQKFYIMDVGKKDLLVESDFKNKEIDKKLHEFIEKIQYQIVRFENIQITSRGTIYTLNKNVPYVRFKADTVNLPFSDVEGLIGATTDKNGKTKIILSINQTDKYSQIITQEFFKHVK